jgi:hypothetical protein
MPKSINMQPTALKQMLHLINRRKAIRSAAALFEEQINECKEIPAEEKGTVGKLIMKHVAEANNSYETELKKIVDKAIEIQSIF